MNKLALINIIQYCLGEDACGRILDAIQHRIPSLSAFCNKSGYPNEWDESLHPRAEDGKFSGKGRGTMSHYHDKSEIDRSDPPDGTFGEMHSHHDSRATPQEMRAAQRALKKTTPQYKIDQLKKLKKRFEKKRQRVWEKGRTTDDAHPEGVWIGTVYGQSAKSEYEAYGKSIDDVDKQIASLEAEKQSLKDPEFSGIIEDWIEDGMLSPDSEEDARQLLSKLKKKGLKGYNLVRAAEAEFAKMAEQ